MNCERCQTELEDFLYGELSERLAAEMRGHLAACAGCAALRAELEHESELFAQFYEQTAIEPAGEMWEAIRERITAEPARQLQTESNFEKKATWWQSLAMGLFGPAPNLIPLRQAAMALLLVALSVVATVVLMKRGENKDIARQDTKQNVTLGPQTTATPVTTLSPVPPSVNDVAKARSEKTPNSLASAPRVPVQPKQLPKPLSDQELLARQLVKAEREYQGAIKMLERAVAKRRDSIEPGAFRQYESSLALIDNSISQSKRALRQQPDDLAAGQFLLAAYARKVELMQTIAMN